jgi:tetratricopeptide (TPR) repeat protein
MLIAAMWDLSDLSKKKKGVIAAAAVLLIYGLSSFIYSSAYKSPIDHWQKAVEMSPQVPDTYYNLGIVSTQIYKDLEAGERNFIKAIELNGSNYSYHNWLGVIYGQKNMKEQALKEFNKAVALAPEEPAPYSNIGFLYFQSGNYAEAELNFKKSLSADPAFKKTYYRLVDLYCIEKKFDEALGFISDARAKGIQLAADLEEQIYKLKKQHSAGSR